MKPGYCVVVPTLNGGARWQEAAGALAAQIPPPERVLVIDSMSDDQTVQIAQSFGFEVQQIPRTEFDHGGTRQAGVCQAQQSEIVVFLTQDAVLTSPDAIRHLIRAFDDPSVGAAYGRQIAGSSASLFEQHARGYNYPAKSATKSLNCRNELGLRTAFCSNSFAAYRLCALNEVGGFPSPSIFAEDMYVSAKLLLSGYRVAYVATAEAGHWHDYSISEEFRRAFDIGVFHQRENWILQSFGSAEGEGQSYVLSGLKYIAKNRPSELPKAFLKYSMKVLGYAAGRNAEHLPRPIARRLSLNRAFWNGAVN